MLDAYIIDRIREQQRSRDHDRVPLRIEVPVLPAPDFDPRRKDQEQEERGTATIDFSI